jgi:hypothetical protein
MNTFTSISKDISGKSVNLISALINMYYEQTKAHAEAVHSAFCYADYPVTHAHDFSHELVA